MTLTQNYIDECEFQQNRLLCRYFVVIGETLLPSTDLLCLVFSEIHVDKRPA